MTAPTLTQRVWAALARFDLDTKRWRGLVLEWHECVKNYGPDSGSAKGALLEIVREAWGIEGIHVFKDGAWWVGEDSEVLLGNAKTCFAGPTEHEALVVALESAPEGCDAKA